MGCGRSCSCVYGVVGTEEREFVLCDDCGESLNLLLIRHWRLTIWL